MHLALTGQWKYAHKVGATSELSAERKLVVPKCSSVVSALCFGSSCQVPSTPSQGFHRIIEWLYLEGTLKLTQFQPPAVDWLPPASSGYPGSLDPGLEDLLVWGTHSFSGQPDL